MNANGGPEVLSEGVIEIPTVMTEYLQEVAWPMLDVRGFLLLETRIDPPLKIDALGGPGMSDSGDLTTRGFRNRHSIVETRAIEAAWATRSSMWL